MNHSEFWAQWEPFLLSLKLASCVTLLLLTGCLPLAWLLSRMKSPFRPILEALASLPIVLPPTVLGFYILIAFSPRSGMGLWLRETVGLELAFSFTGLVFGSCFYSLPFMLQPLISAMDALPRSMIEASLILGKTPWQTFYKIVVPNIRPSLLTACAVTFAHTLGEFGVILMIGGSIKGETRVASIAIYEEVEAMNYSQAHAYSLAFLLFSFAALMMVYSLHARNRNRERHA